MQNLLDRIAVLPLFYADGRCASGWLDYASPIATQLVQLQPKQLTPLFATEDGCAFVRLEQFVPARLDDNTRQLLLDELFESWLQERVAREIGRAHV